MKPLIAYHEASHAVVGHHVGFAVRSVWAGSDGGWCDFAGLPDPAEFSAMRRRDPSEAETLRDRLGLMYAAGPAGEVLFTSEPPGHDGDRRTFAAVTGNRLELWYPRAVALVADRWPSVERLAVAIMKAKGNRLTGAEVRSVLHQRSSS